MPQLWKLSSLQKRHILSVSLSIVIVVFRAFSNSSCVNFCPLDSQPYNPCLQTLVMLWLCSLPATLITPCLPLNVFDSLLYVTISSPWVSECDRVQNSSDWVGLELRSCVVITAIPAPLGPGSVCFLCSCLHVSLHGTSFCCADTPCTQVCSFVMEGWGVHLSVCFMVSSTVVSLLFDYLLNL